MGKARGQSKEIRGQKHAAASLAVLCLLSSVLCTPSSVSAAEQPAAEQPSDTLAKPLSTLVGRLAEQPALSAKDCAELATTTLTYGQRLKSAQQHPQESVIRDALQAVDLGEKTDAKAADWPKLRQDLEALLQRPEEQKKDDQKQDQKNEDQKKQDQEQKQDQQQKDQQKQDEQQKQNEQQQKQNQDAFGDMKDQQEKKSEDQKQQQPPPPKPGTQKVGGQKEEKPTEQVDPELAMPLQKLDQVRNQDSPAKLQQLMQGQKQQKPKTPGKDW